MTSVVPSPSQRTLLEAQLRQHEANLDLAKDYLVGRGITHATATRFRLGVVSEQGSKYDGRLAIPYLTPAGVVDMKYRLLRPAEDGESKYLYPSGTEQRLFNPAALLRRSSTYVLTEGEMDVMTVEQATGLPCVGYPGASSFKPYFARAFYGCAEVVILADGDDAGRKAAKTVMDSILKTADVVRVVELEDGEDANSVLVNQGDGALKELLA